MKEVCGGFTSISTWFLELPGWPLEPWGFPLAPKYATTLSSKERQKNP